MIDFDRSYSAKEVAEILNVSLPTVYEWARAKPEYGGIPSFKFCSGVLIRESDLQKWIVVRRRIWQALLRHVAQGFCAMLFTIIWKKARIA